MSTYAIPVTDQNLDLITFLNDGHQPTETNNQYDYHYLLVKINGPREITSQFVYEHEIQKDGIKFDFNLVVLT